MTNAPERSIAEGLRWVEPRNWGHLGAHSFRLDAVPGEEITIGAGERDTPEPFDVKLHLGGLLKALPRTE